MDIVGMPLASQTRNSPTPSRWTVHMAGRTLDKIEIAGNE
jgi:hypothetical protein